MLTVFVSFPIMATAETLVAIRECTAIATSVALNMLTTNMLGQTTVAPFGYLPKVAFAIANLIALITSVTAVLRSMGTQTVRSSQ